MSQRPLGRSGLASATSVEQLQELLAGARLTLPAEVIADLDAAGR